MLNPVPVEMNTESPIDISNVELWYTAWARPSSRAGAAYQNHGFVIAQIILVVVAPIFKGRFLGFASVTPIKNPKKKQLCLT